MNPPSPSPPSKPTSKYAVVGRLLVFALLLVAGIALLCAIGFDVTRLLETLQATHPLVFFCAMALLPIIGFPIAVFYIFAGLAFPWLTAWLLCAGALAVNMALAYLLGAYLLRDPIRQLVERRGHRIPELGPRGHFRLTFLIRALPGVPYPLQNYILALARTPFPLYMGVSWTVQATFAAGMIVLPKLLLDPTQRKIVIGIGVVVLLLLLKGILHYRQRAHIVRSPD